MRQLLFILFILSTLGACKSTDGIAKSTAKASNQELYEQAVEATMYLTQDKVYNQLWAIDENNEQLQWTTIKGEKYLVAVTWVAEKDLEYYENNKEGYYIPTRGIWITAAPQLLNFIKKDQPKEVDLRLKQLLGLPPTVEKSHFVELYVRPADLFRPCPDAEIDDKVCTTCFPESTTEAHKTWINKTRIGNYFGCQWYQRYPWTQLGYTYDWSPNNPKHIGLSEFILKKGAQAIKNKVYTTKEYLEKE